LADLFNRDQFIVLARELNQLPPYEVLHFISKYAAEKNWIGKDKDQSNLIKLLKQMMLVRPQIVLDAERNSVKMQRQNCADRYIVTVSDDRHTVTANQVASCIHPEQAATIKNAYVNIGYVDLTEQEPKIKEPKTKEITWKKGDRVAWQHGELEIRQGIVSHVNNNGLLYIKVKGDKSITVLHGIHCRPSIADFK
jgi:hypothetical protein